MVKGNRCFLAPDRTVSCNGLQQAHQLLKYSPIPVVAALAGRALGGGCEIVMHCHHTRAFAESYMGQVERTPTHLESNHDRVLNRDLALLRE
jgi:enoyl-CoA hydratase/carnithine racemase